MCSKNLPAPSVSRGGCCGLNVETTKVTTPAERQAGESDHSMRRHRRCANSGLWARKFFLLHLHNYFWTPPPSMGWSVVMKSGTSTCHLVENSDHTLTPLQAACLPDWPRSSEHRLSDNSVWNLILTQNEHVSAIWADRLYEYGLSYLSSIRPCFIGWA